MKRLINGYLVVLAAVLSNGSAFAAGGDVGNGGDAVVCRSADDSVRSIELLDHYEGRVYYNRELRTLDARMTTDAVVRFHLGRLSARIPELGALLKERYEHFWKNADLRHGIELTDVSDSKHLAYPRGCKVEQVAVQSQKPSYPGQKKYTINADLWDLMATEQQAGLVLHELVYGHALELSQHDSIATRRLTSALTSKSWDEMGLKQLGLEYVIFNAQATQVTTFEKVLVVRVGGQAGQPENGQVLALANNESELAFGWLSNLDNGFLGGRKLYEGGNWLQNPSFCQKSECIAYFKNLNEATGINGLIYVDYHTQTLKNLAWRGARPMQPDVQFNQRSGHYYFDLMERN